MGFGGVYYVLVDLREPRKTSIFNYSGRFKHLRLELRDVKPTWLLHRGVGPSIFNSSKSALPLPGIPTWDFPKIRGGGG